MHIQFPIRFYRNTLINSASEEGISEESKMLRSFLSVLFIIGITVTVEAQSPGIDPRGLAAYGSPVIIGIVQEPWRIVIRPDRLPKSSTVKRQADGTYIAELPQQPLDYLVGYIFRVRVQEVLKRDRWVRANQTIEVFSKFQLEGAVSLPKDRQVLLVLAPFAPNKQDFERTSVVRSGQSLSQRGVPFNLRARYYSVAGEANGAVPITEKNQKLIHEIRARIRAR
jgi:hypothetical protein